MTASSGAAVAVAPPSKKEPKQKTTKNKGDKNSALSHPPYFQMIKEALMALHERTGSSPYAIAKHMEEDHKGELPANFRKILAVQLRKFVASGKLVKVKASFKLSDAGKKDAKLSAKPAVLKEKSTAAAAATEKDKIGGTKRKGTKTAIVAEPKTKKAKSTAAKAKPKKTNLIKSPVKRPRQPKSLKSPGAKRPRKAVAA